MLPVFAVRGIVDQAIPDSNVRLLVLLDRGREVEIGTHDELVQNNNPYATLFKQQFDKVLSQTQ